MSAGSPLPSDSRIRLLDVSVIFPAVVASSDVKTPPSIGGGKPRASRDVRVVALASQQSNWGVALWTWIISRIQYFARIATLSPLPSLLHQSFECSASCASQTPLHVFPLSPDWHALVWGGSTFPLSLPSASSLFHQQQWAAVSVGAVAWRGLRRIPSTVSAHPGEQRTQGCSRLEARHGGSLPPPWTCVERRLRCRRRASRPRSSAASAAIPPRQTLRASGSSSLLAVSGTQSLALSGTSVAHACRGLPNGAAVSRRPPLLLVLGTPRL